MTDNTIAYGTADDQTSYSFQLQPVYSIPTELGFNFIARGIIPIVFYSTELFGGSYIGYNNSVTYDWSASSSNAWQVPVGFTVGKTFILKNGYMMDVNLGG